MSKDSIAEKNSVEFQSNSVEKKSNESDGIKKDKNNELQVNEASTSKKNNVPIISAEINKNINNPNQNRNETQKNENYKNNESRLTEKIKLEITLFDGDQNKILSDYEMDIKSIYDWGELKTQKIRSDKNGKVNFSNLNFGRLFFQIYTKDFSVLSKRIVLRNGFNQFNARLYKGGIVEIYAIDEHNKIVENLIATRFVATTEFESNSKSPINLPIYFNPSKKIYELSNAPMEEQELVFNAKGFYQSKHFKITVGPNQSARLVVKLQTARKIFIDLDLKEKPEFIRISNKEGAKIFKNKSNIFEYFLQDIEEKYLDIYVENYVPQVVVINPEKDIYNLTLIKSIVVEIKVIDEKDQPVENARITYIVNEIPFYLKTDKSGIALLEGICENFSVDIKVEEYDFLNYMEKLSFDSINFKSRTIVLKRGNYIYGKIKSGDNFISGAKITLMKKYINGGSNNGCISSNDGSYLFGNRFFSKNNYDDYYIQAYHPDFGISILFPFKWEDKSQVIDLNLNKDKSLTRIKLVDSSGRPLPKKNITIDISEDYTSPYSESRITNEKGEIELFDLIPSEYLLKIEDDVYYFKDDSFTLNLPKDEVVLTAEKGEMRKVIVLTPKGNVYKGALKGYLEISGYSSPMEIIVNEDGSFSFVLENLPMQDFAFLFFAPGFSVARVNLFENIEDYPREFKVVLQEGKNVKIKVISAQNNAPIPFIILKLINSNGLPIQLIQSDESGEISVNHLTGTFIVNITDENFAPYNNEFDCDQVQNIQIKLKKGGNLKCHLTLDNGKRGSVYLDNRSDYFNLDVDGKYEFINLPPGEYSLNLTIFGNGNPITHKIPGKILIEADKTIELNLDDAIKTNTSLRVSIIKNGAFYTDSSQLKIYNESQKIIFNNVNEANLIENIIPGEYIFNLKTRENEIVAKFNIIGGKENAIELFLPSAKLSIIVKDEEGQLIPKVKFRLYSSEKYLSVHWLKSYTQINGLIPIDLMPKTSVYFMVESTSSIHQLNVIGPINLEPGQLSNIVVTLPYARKLPNIQIVDIAGEPLMQAFFSFKDENGIIYQRVYYENNINELCSNKNGFLPENGWPKGRFTLMVCKLGYDFQEISIAEDQDSEKFLQIKLNKASSLKCNFPYNLKFPISVCLLNDKGILIQKPFLHYAYNSNVYFENISGGSVTFPDLAAGTYYIGYFWNGSSTRLISKQGPFSISVGQKLEIISNLVFNE